MSRDRGIRLQNALAAYLARWWPNAESAGSGRPGSDVLGTPGIVWECKTAREFRPLEWCKQARRHATGLMPTAVCVYIPDGMGEKSIGAALAMMPLEDMMALLIEAGYAKKESSWDLS